MNSDIFISYSRKDMQKVKRIKDDIEQATGLNCWMDMDGIESGSQFEDVIITSINKTKIVLFMLSENSMQSPWAKDEVRYAVETNKKVVPVNIDGSKPRDWFLFKFSGKDIIFYDDAAQKARLMLDLKRWTGNGGSTMIHGFAAVPDASSSQQANKSTRHSKSHLPYFIPYVKAGIWIQSIIFLFILYLTAKLFCMRLLQDKGAMLPDEIFLIMDLLAMIFCTIYIMTNKKFKWSFFVFDLIAIGLLFSIASRVCADIPFEEARHSSKDLIIPLLSSLGHNLKLHPFYIYGAFGILYLLHNAIVLLFMYSRTLWFKIPKNIRKYINS